MEISLRARVRAGDPDAFRQLFDEHASVVHRHAVRMTGDWVMADDIVSLTFLEAWRLRERVFPGDDSLRPWLLGIATWELASRTKRVRCRSAHPESTSTPPRSQRASAPADALPACCD
ncbi:RNA polymerase sigma factor [Streptomyces olivochromogenes]|uniref:RNA polymerase sigma factor n=1 Tax=Streptomyces olivochromogenes TaxID=1963 RepID=UPI000ADA383F